MVDPDWPVFEFTGAHDKSELIYELNPSTDRDGREYEMVGQFLSDDDFYQGLNMVTVIKRKSDGKEFGYFWWNDISKHGDAYIESNGDEYGLIPDDFPDDFDWDNDFVYHYVFVPVEKYTIPAYREACNG